MKDSKIEIDMINLLLNSANKQGSHNPFVRAGTGVHKSKKTYIRKAKHKTKSGGEEYEY